ncbi:hypothetical protein KY332_04800 [Candidatus Woesearchaeota archaeon]|nr:hypothetical protein [Candidatus Woesearchaeota archaeon]
MKHEIELKALLTPEQHKELIEKLSSEFKLINEESVHTTRYKPGDIRLRFSHNMFEMVEKQGDVSQGSRKEKVTKLNNKEELELKRKELEEKGYEAYPSWITHKKEFMYPYNGFDYTLCFQHTENFAHILEVEFMTEEDDSAIHEPNIRAIMMKLGVKPINPEEFKEMIKDYIDKNK